MNCTKHLCDRLIISDSVTFADTTLTINIPDGVYGNNCRYCIVVAQTIPAETTITANVVITIGDDTTTYPLTDCRGIPVSACSINTRTRYTVVVNTTSTSGTFRLVGKVPCTLCNNNLSSLPAPATTTPTP
jgi:hypothetical protein